MTWLTWRQHRGELLATVGVLGILTLILILTGVPLHATFADGTDDCVRAAATARGPECGELVGAFLDQYQSMVNFIVPVVTLLPACAGIFIGAPLVAREFEHGTWQLAWTQAVPRTRWLAVKLAMLTAAVVIAAAAFTAAYTWWHDPVDRTQGRLISDAYNMEGLVFVAYSVFAFALGTFAGTVIRRAVPAMAATFGVFLVVRLAVEMWLRPRFLPPKTVAFDPVTRSDFRIGGTGGEWILDRGILAADGRRLTTGEQAVVVQEAARARMDLPSYLHQQGMQRWYDYHPADRFWPLQFIESGLFIALAVLLMTFVVWRVRRRII